MRHQPISRSALAAATSPITGGAFDGAVAFNLDRVAFTVTFLNDGEMFVSCPECGCGGPIEAEWAVYQVLSLAEQMHADLKEGERETARTGQPLIIASPEVD